MAPLLDVPQKRKAVPALATTEVTESPRNKAQPTVVAAARAEIVQRHASIAPAHEQRTRRGRRRRRRRGSDRHPRRGPLIPFRLYHARTLHHDGRTDRHALLTGLVHGMGSTRRALGGTAVGEGWRRCRSRTHVVLSWTASCCTRVQVQRCGVGTSRRGRCLLCLCCVRGESSFLLSRKSSCFSNKIH